MVGFYIMEDVPELLKRKGDMHYGQFIWNVLAMIGSLQAPEANKLFYIEDKDLAVALKLFLESQKTPVLSTMLSARHVERTSQRQLLKATIQLKTHYSGCV